MAPGDQCLADRYNMTKRLGDGTFGEVLLAKKLDTGDIVAIKRFILLFLVLFFFSFIFPLYLRFNLFIVLKIKFFLFFIFVFIFFF